MSKADFLWDSQAKRLFSAGILNTTEDLGVRGDEVPLYCSGMAPRRPPPDLRYPCRGFRQRPAQRAVFMRGWERDRAAARDLGVVRRGSSIGVAQIGGGGGSAICATPIEDGGLHPSRCREMARFQNETSLTLGIWKGSGQHLR